MTSPLPVAGESENIRCLKKSLAHVTLTEVERIYSGSGASKPVHALGPINLEIMRGEFFSVVGPSGCGKSTLLDIISGLATPTRGTVVIDGMKIRGSLPNGLGVIFQQDASFPWLTVWDNVAFGLRRQGVNKDEIRYRVQNALEFTALTEFSKAYPAQLSGGMRQRVCIARTLVLKPRLILLDEPFGALDQQTRLLMGDELLKLWRHTGTTIILITHSLDEAEMLSDRVGVMSSRPGHFMDMIQTGWPADRDSRIAASAAFGKISGRLWELLRAESIKALQRVSTLNSKQ
jgi:NitT/TauT family transport system ATP-binding protein